MELHICSFQTDEAQVFVAYNRVVEGVLWPIVLHYLESFTCKVKVKMKVKVCVCIL
jgi:hypothetical protein